MTTNEYIDAIDKRCSRRNYTGIDLKPEVVEVIKQMVDSVNKHSGIKFTFVEDGTPPFTVITGKFSYIAVTGDDNQKAREDCGYFGEMIVLECVYHGLGTCWVSGTFNENKVYEQVKIPKGQRLYALIVVGYAKESKSMKEKIMYNATHKKNKRYQDMFSVCDRKLPDSFKYAMELVEKAPSAVNRRPVDFKYENGILSAKVEDPYSDKSIDFGIAKFHFEIGARAKGVEGKWNKVNSFITTGDKVIKFPESEVNSKDE